MMDDEAPTPPLAGVRILDCTQVVAGNRLGMVLADFGADVIKVEHPVDGDALRRFGSTAKGIPLYWTLLGRNKRSITLALNTSKGQQIFRRLIDEVRPDVVLESFRPGTFEKWGLGYDVLSELHPGLIFVRVSGFGQTGPYSDRPGFGTLAEAASGFAYMNGHPDGPPTLPPMALADGIAALYSVVGVLLALRARERDGLGQIVDSSLLESLFSLVANRFLDFDQLGLIAERKGSRAASSSPRNLYRTKDDRWIAISASTQRIAERLFVLMRREDLIEDPRFSSNAQRVANAAEIDEIVGAWVATYDRDEVLQLMVDASVAAAPVTDMSDMAVDPHLAERGAIESVDHPVLGTVRMPGVLPRLTRTPGRIRHPGPPKGSSTDELYRELLGLSDDELASLQDEKVI